MQAFMQSPFGIALVFVAGLCAGSFINCMAYRREHGESIVHGRSHCPACNHELGALELVPVLSWVLQRGRCRHCGAAVSVRYPAVELLAGIVFVGVACIPSHEVLEMAELVALCSVLLYISLVDLDSYTIPNGAIVAALAIRVAYLAAASFQQGSLLVGPIIDSLIGGVALGGGMLVLVLIADHVLGRESMGGGDLKLLFVAGCYLGWQQGVFCLLIASVLGILFALVCQACERRMQSAPAEQNATPDDEAAGQFFGRTIPFGPAIACALWVTLMCGSQVMSWYFGLFAA